MPTLTIRLAPTVGWVIAIGIGVTATYFVSSKADEQAQKLSASIYDYLR